MDICRKPLSFRKGAQLQNSKLDVVLIISSIFLREGAQEKDILGPFFMGE